MSNPAGGNHPKEEHKQAPTAPPVAHPAAKEAPHAAPQEAHPAVAHPPAKPAAAKPILNEPKRAHRVTGKTRCKGVMPHFKAPVHRAMVGGASSTPTPSITSTILQNTTVLVTSGNDGQGNSGSAAMDLNTVLGNLNGGFTWGGTNFSNNARNISLATNSSNGLLTLQADLPDTNGDYHTSTVQMAQDIGQFWDDPTALRTMLSVPNSVAHANNENADQADQQVLDQVNCPEQYIPVSDVQTLSVSQVQGIANGTSDLVAANGPAAGAAVSIIEVANVACHVAAVANGAAQAKSAGDCVIL